MPCGRSPRLRHSIQGGVKWITRERPKIGAAQGLIVAWGGYRQSVAKEASRLFFEIRLWDSGDLVRMIETPL
jgi:hypothetical protein